MIHHYSLKPTVWHAKPWVFSWDEEAGVVSGRDADIIQDMATWGEISAHPYPWAHTFGPEPLKSKTDMAAIIGWEHELPPDLVGFYPQLPDDGIPEESYEDESGVIVLGREHFRF